jgi:hypothetical protein
MATIPIEIKGYDAKLNWAKSITYPAPASAVRSDDPCATGQTPLQRAGSTLASRLFGQAWLARHVLRPIAPARPASCSALGNLVM